MADDNISKFNWAIGYVFSELFLTFPTPECVLIPNEVPEQFADQRELHKCLEDTVNWLVTEGALQIRGTKLSKLEGYVFANPRPGIEANRFTLSATALAALDVKVEALDNITVKEVAEAKDISGFTALGHTISVWLGGLARGYFPPD